MAIEGKDDDDLLIDDSPEELEPDTPTGGDDPEPETRDDPEPESPRQTAQDLPSKKGSKPPKIPPGTPHQPQTVPLATFLQEKNKFTEALETERAERKKIQDQLDKILNPPKAPPKFAEDPEGYIAHANKQTAQEVLAKLDEHGQKVKEVADASKQTSEQRAEAEFVEELGRSGEVFAQQYADYGDALGYVRRAAYQQMKLWNPNAPDKQILDAITKQEIQMARQAMSVGMNPHEVAYRMALINGYQPKQSPDPKKASGKRPAQRRAEADDDDSGPGTLDPDLTLGRSTGDAGDDEGEDLPDPDTVDPFDDAFKEVFRKRRRA